MGFIGAIFIMSGIASGAFFNWRMKHALERYAYRIKTQGVMLEEFGTQLEELGAEISAYAAPSTGTQLLPSQRKVMDNFAHEVRNRGEKLKQYSGQLIRDMQKKEPQDALATMADVEPLVPENLKTIKEQGNKINELEKDVLKLKSRIQDLQMRLSQCLMQPDMSYPPYEGYRQYRRDPSENGP